ncbi:MAG: hypothetical protein HQL94_02295 [Magnetococcales bacterium]|nr:hypothetical protein [Magnetococcales bacterium]MBF0437828.1 hypothetical protein [Magnetococcales bacterium]
MTTPAMLEAEWMENLQRHRRQTIQGLTDWLMEEINVGPDETFFATLSLAGYQILKRRIFARYFSPLLAFAWKQAVLVTHPAKTMDFLGALERGIDPHLTRSVQNDLMLFQIITDNFEEDGFVSVALHVVQRVHGDIEKKPDNLDLAVGLSLWMDERYQHYREALDQAKIMI